MFREIKDKEMFDKIMAKLAQIETKLYALDKTIKTNNKNALGGKNQPK